MIFTRIFGAILLVTLLVSSTANAIRSVPIESTRSRESISVKFLEAPEYKNGVHCRSLHNDWSSASSSCNRHAVHVAMTIDLEYLRGSMAAIHSILTHASCPENVFFHFIASDSSSVKPSELGRIVQSSFPSLNFKLYKFDENLVNDLISSSIREALEKPLNYARSYLADLLEPCVKKVIYLDSDVVLVDDIQKLWRGSLTDSIRTIAAPEYCHTNFTNYFSDEFWRNARLSKVFRGKRPCYFNTGVMVMDLERWREGDYTKNIEKWMDIQKKNRIYELGSLPPFLLVFGGEIEAIDHRWNQHGLGGDNVKGSCRCLHAGQSSLLHWSGKGKPWARLDARMPCPVDYLWAPYDLYRHHGHTQHPDH